MPEDTESNRPYQQRPVVVLADGLGVGIPQIRQCQAETVRRLDEIQGLVSDHVTDDYSVTCFGSSARFEFTSGSDVDWTMLLDCRTDPRHFRAAQNIATKLEEGEFNGPGAEGTFGGIAHSHSIVHKIGGSDDSNMNTTQRILLLLESVPLSHPGAYTRVLRSILRRYIDEDWGWTANTLSTFVPRFLQNDISRYWRTVAVDFAYKRRERAGRGWALRTIKLRMSRKMTFAAGVLACFACELEKETNGLMEDNQIERAILFLESRLRLAPIDIISKAILQNAPDRREDIVTPFLESYDWFLALLDDPTRRKHLESLRPEDVAEDSLFKDARAEGHRFQASLSTLFYDVEPIAPLTKQYGMF